MNSDGNDGRARRELAGPTRARSALTYADRERMWQVVRGSWREQAGRRRRRRTARQWGGAGIGLAAMLVIGIVVGRLSSAPDAVPPADRPAAFVTEGASIDPPLATPYRLAVGEHFEQAETLLVLFAAEEPLEADAELVALARELAATTRLLMESRVGRDAEVRAMLLDLELLLVQIARLVDNGDPLERELVREGAADATVLARLRRMMPERANASDI